MDANYNGSSGKLVAVSGIKIEFAAVEQGGCANIFSLWESRAFRPGEGNAVRELFRFSTRLKSPTRTLPDRHPPVANSLFPLPERSFLAFDPPEGG
jgi:hypothetical protein